MSRYIEVDHLKKSVEELQDCYNGFSDTYDKSCILGLIDEEPTADVVPVTHGYWVTKWNSYFKQDLPYCSVCGGVNPSVRETDYCPNCGAKMDEVTD